MGSVRQLPTIEDLDGSFRNWLTVNGDRLSKYQPTDWRWVADHFRRLAPFHELLFSEGWARWGWPEDFGGLGGHPALRGVVYDAVYDSGLELPRGFQLLEVVGPTLIEFAPLVAERNMPDLLSGRTIVCQGFSEPDAGSDLASLRTRATRDGSSWRIEGQKVWVSHAHVADWCLLLARTGEPESRHRGLTMFWTDMKGQGVTSRPIELADGRDELAEVFLDGVVVPTDSVVGKVGGGWEVAMFLLQFERGNYAWERQAWMRMQLRDALSGGFVAPGAAEVDDAAMGHAYLDVMAVRARARQTLYRLAAGEWLGPATSIDKLLMAEAEQSVLDAARAAVWPALELGLGEKKSLEADWFFSRAASIYGGAAEVQRDVVGGQLLGLARS